MRIFTTVLSAVWVLACTPGETPPEVDPLGTFAPTGDADAGRLAMLDGAYVQCGIPVDWAELYWGSSDAYKVDGRSPDNADLPYYLTAYTPPSGVKLATTNCLYCHGDLHYGAAELGLGNSSLSFVDDLTSYASIVTGLATDDDERAEVARWSERVLAASPYIVTDTRGANPADTLAQALFTHRDPVTLEWSSEPTMDPPLPPVPTDIPPLWNMRKKDRMLYTGSGRGNLARIMMTATVLCTESTDDAEALVPLFQDMWAWMTEIEPPANPGDIDAVLAEAGHALFEAQCSECHGTYGDDWTYPNRVVSVDEVGTDPMLIERFAGDGRRFGEWFNGSWYGQDAELAEPEGYIAPPLDGIWATAPYLHNGSVPTLAGVLDSPSRPTYWSRSAYTASGRTGLAVIEHGEGRDVVDDSEVFDTTRPGFGNGGHLFGDTLSGADRDALIEYLRTL